MLGFILLIVSCGCELPPVTWIEKGIFSYRADNALNKITKPEVPPNFGGDVFIFKESWIVILYGESALTGHVI